LADGPGAGLSQVVARVRPQDGASAMDTGSDTVARNALTDGQPSLAVALPDDSEKRIRQINTDLEWPGEDVPNHVEDTRSTERVLELLQKLVPDQDGPMEVIIAYKISGSDEVNFARGPASVQTYRRMLIDFMFGENVEKKRIAWNEFKSLIQSRLTIKAQLDGTIQTKLSDIRDKIKTMKQESGEQIGAFQQSWTRLKGGFGIEEDIGHADLVERIANIKRELEKQVSSLRGESDTRDKTIAHLRDELKNTNKRAQAIKTTLSARTEDVTRLTAGLNDMTAYRDDAVRALDSATEKSRQLHESELTVIQTEIESKKEEVTAAQGEIARLQASLTENEATIQSLNARLETASETTATFQSDIFDLTDTIVTETGSTMDAVNAFNNLAIEIDRLFDQGPEVDVEFDAANSFKMDGFDAAVAAILNSAVSDDDKKKIVLQNPRWFPKQFRDQLPTINTLDMYGAAMHEQGTPTERRSWEEFRAKASALEMVEYDPTRLNNMSDDDDDTDSM